MRPPASVAELEALFARWSSGSPQPGTSWLNWFPIERSTKQRIGFLQATIDISARDATREAAFAITSSTRGSCHLHRYGDSVRRFERLEIFFGFERGFTT
ncbi:MAG: hypothetical protein NVS2B17_23580 [Candidatus Velthaea sp.]